MATNTKLDSLVINYLTQSQYDNAKSSGTLNANQIYMTPASTGTAVEDFGSDFSCMSWANLASDNFCKRIGNVVYFRLGIYSSATSSSEGKAMNPDTQYELCEFKLTSGKTVTFTTFPVTIHRALDDGGDLIGIGYAYNFSGKIYINFYVPEAFTFQKGKLEFSGLTTNVITATGWFIIED